MTLATETPAATLAPGPLAEALAPVHAAVRAFTEALGEERTALTEGSAEALAAAAERKRAAAEHLADARQGLFAAAWRAGFAGDGAGVRRWAERIAPLAPDLLERYRELGARLAECERENRLHGRMIAARSHAVESGLDLLLGRPERSAAPVYDAGGRRQRGAGGRMLETA